MNGAQLGNPGGRLVCLAGMAFMQTRQLKSSRESEKMMAGAKNVTPRQLSVLFNWLSIGYPSSVTVTARENNLHPTTRCAISTYSPRP
jgi:hypothetical protein